MHSSPTHTPHTLTHTHREAYTHVHRYLCAPISSTSWVPVNCKVDGVEVSPSISALLHSPYASHRSLVFSAAFTGMDSWPDNLTKKEQATQGYACPWGVHLSHLHRAVLNVSYLIKLSIMNIQIYLQAKINK